MNREYYSLGGAIRRRKDEELKTLRARVVELEAERDRLREAYNELLYAVQTKHPGETRHQTALRYIQWSEKPSDQAHSTLQEEK
jgi:hypothetical protein